MNTPQRRTEIVEPQVDWEARKAPRHIPQEVIETVKRKLNFMPSERIVNIR